MDRITQILEHPRFIKYMNKNADMELDRIFCKHNLAHVKEVARISLILAKEQGLSLAEDVILAAAYLHDIGRHVQYETGEKHAIVSAKLAPEILRECGYQEDEIVTIVDAINTHSDNSIVGAQTFNGLLAKADLLSRNCRACATRDLCNWPEEDKNHPIV